MDAQSVSSPAVINVFVHGVCSPNPGTGGWGAVLLFEDGERRELMGYEEETTNNRMELRAAVEALRAVPPGMIVRLHSTSQYLCGGLQQHLASSRLLFPVASAPRSNEEVWEELLGEAARHRVEVVRSEGKARDPWLQRADELARSALPSARLPLDDEQAIHLFVAVVCPEHEKGGGASGWAVRLRYRGHYKDLCGQENEISSSRLHLLAVHRGLKAIKRLLPVHLYTTSAYLQGGLSRWLGSWQARDWVTQEGKAVSHRDLWEGIAEFVVRHDVSSHLVRGSLPADLQHIRRLALQAARPSAATHSSRELQGVIPAVPGRA